MSDLTDFKFARGFEGSGPTLIGLYRSVSRLLLHERSMELSSMELRDVRRIHELMGRRRLLLQSEGAVAPNSWIPSFIHEQTNWVHSVWHILTSDFWPEYMMLDAHLFFWALWSTMETARELDMTIEIQNWCSYFKQQQQPVAFAFISSIWSNMLDLNELPVTGIVVRDQLKSGLFFGIFRKFLEDNAADLENSAITHYKRSDPSSVSEATTSRLASVTESMWRPDIIQLPTTTAFTTGFESSILTTDVTPFIGTVPFVYDGHDMVTMRQSGMDGHNSFDWSVSPPIRDTYVAHSNYHSDHDIRTSTSPPFPPQLTPGLFNSPPTSNEDFRPTSPPFSPTFLNPDSLELSPRGSLYGKRINKSPIRKPRRLSRPDEDDVHGWDAETRTCKLEIDGRICNTKVKTYNNFLRHSRFQHGKKQPREHCHVCGQSFGRPDALRNHCEKSKRHQRLLRSQEDC